MTSSLHARPQAPTSRRTPFKKRAAILGAASAMFVVFGFLTAAPASAASSNCAVVARTATSQTTACAKPSYLNGQNFVSIWRDSIYNNTPATISATCKATTKGTVSFQYSFSASGAIKAWVFADVSAKASGGIKTSITTGIDVSSAFKIPANRITNCDRGIVRQNFASTVTLTTSQQGRPPKI